MEWIFQKKYFFLFVILIIASFLRLYNITETPPGFYADEAMYANNGLYAWHTGDFRVFYPENFGREGLWPNVIGFFLYYFSNEPWIPRALAAIMGILTVLGTYFLARELFRVKRKESSLVESVRSVIARPELIALLSAFFLATSVWHIIFSRIGFRAILAPLFLVWAVYFALTAFRTATSRGLTASSSFRRVLLYSLLGGIFFGLGFHTYIAFRVMPLLIAVIFLLFWFRSPNWAIRMQLLYSGIIYTLAALLVFLPLGLYFLSHPEDFMGRTSAISVFNSPTPLNDLGLNITKTLGMFNVIGDYNLRHNYPGRPELFWPVGLLFLIGIGAGFMRRFRTSFQFEYFPFTILLVWFLLAFLPTIISNEGLPHALRSLLLIPPAFLFAGFAGAWLISFLRARVSFFTRIPLLSTITLVTFASLLFFEAYTTYFIAWNSHPNLPLSFDARMVQVGRDLNTFSPRTPQYVVTDMAIHDDFRLMPVAIQPLLFITNTLTADDQRTRNIFYILPSERALIPPYARVVEL